MGALCVREWEQEGVGAHLVKPCETGGQRLIRRHLSTTPPKEEPLAFLLLIQQFMNDHADIDHREKQIR